MSKESNSLLKNTMALYIRMLFSVCTSLYVSRIILKALGVDDFGVYNVVAGIIVLLGFINSSMSIATSRFLTLAMGRKSEDELQKVYTAAFVLHLSIALLVFVLSETLGLWIVNCYLVIAPERLFAANMLYQFSVGLAIVSFVQVPFVAMIISDERMSVYARIDIVNNVLKLVAAIVISYILWDRLIIYGMLLFIASIFVLLLYLCYCKRNYSQYKLNLHWDWDVIKPMLLFSGWDLLGCGGVSLQQQGRQILINKFFTVVHNAGNGMAIIVGSALSVFTSNVIVAFRPRIMKSYSIGDYEIMSKQTENTMFISLLLMSLVFVPLVLCLDTVLHIWLEYVPPYTLELCRLTLIIGYLEVINTVIKIGIHAAGRMKWFTVFSFTANCLIILFTYYFYTRGMNLLSTYYIAVLFAIINIIIGVR